jgi:4-amino-4-deoxy-L-arabinose transferase-like glycosyltransferase
MPGVQLRQLLVRGPRPGNARWETAWQVLIVLVVCGLVYWPFLGHSGFAFSEGQRVFPGWGMARGGDWLVPRLLGQAYLRKPPGMPWAVALASFVLGKNEFSARAVSALAVTLGALTSFAFGTRWFGRPWGLAAGLAYALTPLFFFSPTSPVGRSAEIEALHNLFVQASMLVIIELTVARPRGVAAVRWGAALAVCLIGMVLVKGPSGLPCVGGAVLGGCVAQRSVRALWSGWLWAGLIVGSAVAGYTWWLVGQRADQLSEPVIRQSAAHFLWPREQIADVLMLPLATLVSALPGALSLPLVWTRAAMADRFARALAWTCVTALVIYTVAGVPNARYAMPAITILPVLWAPVLRDHFAVRPAERAPWRRILLDRPGIWAVGLLIFGIASIGYTETRRAQRTSGEAAGIALGDVLEDKAELWGDQLADQRPEVLYYAQVRAHQLGKEVRARWVPARRGEALPMPPPGGYLVLLESPELGRYERAGLLSGMREVYRGNAHKFAFRVYRNPAGAA